MKKALFAFFLSMAIAGMAVAQCTPDPNATDPENNGEFTPQTLICTAGQPWTQTVSILCPPEGEVTPGNFVPLHHVQVKNIVNKPAWVSYACLDPNCDFLVNNWSCVLITSSMVPVTAGPDTIILDVIVDAYIDVMGSPVLAESDYNGGSLTLIVNEAVGIGENGTADFYVNPSFPNPFTNTTTLSCYTANATKLLLNVFNAAGSLVATEVLEAQSGDNTFTFNGNELPSGMYYYTISDADNRSLKAKLLKAE